MQAHLNQPYLPAEVIHDIIDKVPGLPAGDSDCHLTQSNIALASRCCRHWINFHRFSRLEIYVHATPFDRLHALSGILGSNVWQEQEGIAQHIRLVSLMLGQGHSGTPPHIQSRDSIIAEILMTLFTGSGDTYSLFIGTCRRFRHYTNNGPYHISGLAFDTLGSETIAALHDLSRNRHLTTLRLERMWNVPSSFLTASTILNLHITHAHFITSETSDYHRLLPNLMYLEAKEAPSFVPTCYGPQNEHTVTIYQVKFWLRSEEEYPGLFIIGKYAMSLEIVLHRSKIFSMPFNQDD